MMVLLLRLVVFGEQSVTDFQVVKVLADRFFHLWLKQG